MLKIGYLWIVVQALILPKHYPTPLNKFWAHCIKLDDAVSRELDKFSHLLFDGLSRSIVRLLKTRARGYKLFSCSTQLSMKFYMLIRIKISRNSAFFRLR